MEGLTVDASVWTAAVDARDPCCPASRTFLAEAARRKVRLFVPTIAVVEVACALARRCRDAASARRLTAAMLAPGRVTHLPLDQDLLSMALAVGTSSFLRGADSLYVATARLTESRLISWDGEHLERGGAWSPEAWLDGGSGR